MRQFVIRTALFFSPILLLFVITEIFYSGEEGGDLTRVGYLPSPKKESDQFKDEFSRPILYTRLSEVSQKKKYKYTALTIGDSFSNQGKTGYQNYLPSDSLRVLHYDLRTNESPINLLYGVINGDILDSIDVNFVILQSVEREFVKRGQKSNIKRDNKLKFADTQKYKEAPAHHQSTGIGRDFPPTELVKFPLYNLLYSLDDNAFISKVIKVKTHHALFSNHKNELLFLKEDLEMANRNNDSVAVSNLNQELNKLSSILSKKNIQLIVLPSPDKFDIYYNEITQKSKYLEPKFFDVLKGYNKEYQYIDSKKILSGALNKRKDVYYYGDTHWTPAAAKIIANQLRKTIEVHSSSATIY